MGARYRTHITEGGASKSIVHYHAGGGVYWSGQRHGGNGGSGRGTVAGDIDDGAVLVSIVRRVLQIGRGVGGLNRPIDIGPRVGAILVDLPLVSRSRAVSRFDGKPRVNSPNLSSARRARSHGCRQA